MNIVLFALAALLGLARAAASGGGYGGYYSRRGGRHGGYYGGGYYGGGYGGKDREAEEESSWRRRLMYDGLPRWLSFSADDDETYNLV